MWSPASGRAWMLERDTTRASPTPVRVGVVHAFGTGHHKGVPYTAVSGRARIRNGTPQGCPLHGRIRAGPVGDGLVPSRFESVHGSEAGHHDGRANTAVSNFAQDPLRAVGDALVASRSRIHAHPLATTTVAPIRLWRIGFRSCASPTRPGRILHRIPDARLVGARVKGWLQRARGCVAEPRGPT